MNDTLRNSEVAGGVQDNTFSCLHINERIVFSYRILKDYWVRVVSSKVLL